jgi:predicted dehydrogenase
MIKKILVIGCGSIGQRHIRALLKLEADIAIAAFRTKQGHHKNLPEDISSHVVQFGELENALAWHPTHMIISNPTSLHAEYIEIGIKAGCELFVEKPLVQNYSDIENIGISMDKIINYPGMVGFNLRFNSIIQKVKVTIDSGIYGKVIYSNISVGHYLPLWHPYEDYKNGYYAKKSLGGGVLRTLSHELDLIQHFFGGIINLTAKMDKLSDLEIDVEDCVDIIFEMRDCKRVTLHMDYLNPLPLRQGKIIFKQAMLEYDFFSNEVYITDYETQKRVLLFENTDDFDVQYIEQMKHFIDAKESEIASKISNSFAIMKIIGKCEKSKGNLETL